MTSPRPHGPPRTSAAVALLLLAGLSIPGCAPTSPPPSPGPAGPDPLPALPVEQVSTGLPRLPAEAPHAVTDPLARLPLGEPVTLAAADVDVGALLAALGESLGISLVVDPDIDDRITVNFEAVPAREALRAVLAEAGLFVATGPPELPYGDVVFYTVPLDIETTSAETIAARFGVSMRVAEFIVRSRAGAAYR